MKLWKNLADSYMGYVYCALSAIVSCILGVYLPTAWFLPFLNALFIYPLYMVPISSGQLRRAFVQMMVWTIFMSLTIITFAIFIPDRAGSHILQGLSYRDEMFRWVRTGTGAESNLRAFLPIHITHLIIFSVLSLLTGGFAGLLFGAILLNYMNFYVGSLIRESHFAWQAIVLGWQIWAIVRVIGFITLAIGLSHLFFVYVRKKECNRTLMNEYLIGGISLIVLDILLKASLAHDWQTFLHPILP